MSALGVAAVSLSCCVACAVVAGPSQPQSIRSIVANPDAFVGQRITVMGRVHIELNRSLEPCQQGDPRCGWPVSATAHVVETGEARSATNSIDLYEKKTDGSEVPWPCAIVSSTAADCSPFVADKITTVTGTFVKDRQPVQTVGSSGGGATQVLQYRDVYFLAVAR